MEEKAEQLANDHWGYVEGLLQACDVDEDVVAACKYVYTTAFVHGWKHCAETPVADDPWRELKWDI